MVLDYRKIKDKNPDIAKSIIADLFNYTDRKEK